MKPSSRFEMYFGKLEKKSDPRIAMSNMLWWFETMMYDVHGSISGAHAGTSAGCSFMYRRIPCWYASIIARTFGLSCSYPAREIAACCHSRCR